MKKEFKYFILFLYIIWHPYNIYASDLFGPQILGFQLGMDAKDLANRMNILCKSHGGKIEINRGHYSCQPNKSLPSLISAEVLNNRLDIIVFSNSVLGSGKFDMERLIKKFNIKGKFKTYPLPCVVNPKDNYSVFFTRNEVDNFLWLRSFDRRIDQ